MPIYGRSMVDHDPLAMDSIISDLKKELKRLIMSILDGDECMPEVFDEAMKLLRVLKESKFRRSQSLTVDLFTPPDEFKCPISKQLMRDPVILATGQTYDRQFIQKWLKDGNEKCPQTDKILSHTELTPNNLVKEMIKTWCNNNGVQPISSHADRDDISPSSDHDRLSSLLKMMSSSPSDQKAAANELRLLTKRLPSFRPLFGESMDSIPQLLSPLSQSRGSITDLYLHEDIVTTILNLSLHDGNKKKLADNSLVIPFLVNSVQSGTMETRSNAAAALFSLSSLDSNKLVIGKSGALKHLIDLVEDGTPSAMKDAASAIFNLCIASENRSRAVLEGAVSVVLKKITNRVLFDEMLSILAILSSLRSAVEEMSELGAVSCLLNILRENTCERNKENCIAVLYAICFYDRSKLRELRKDEDDNGSISKIAQSGTARAKRKANGILEKLLKISSVTHTT